MLLSQDRLPCVGFLFRCYSDPYQELETWAQSFGPVRAYGVEGSGSYGADLSRFLQASGHTVIEVNRPHC